MSAFTALLAALSYGTGDFLGGVATRRAGTVVPVIVVSHVVGLGVVLALVPVFPGEVMGRAIIAGSLGGIAGAVGFAMLYRGLAVGRMAVVAPITALVSAVVPLVWGLIGAAERPGAIPLVGAAIGVVAIPLVALVDGGAASEDGGMGLPEAFGAGLGFALFFIALDASGDASGVVPLVAARATSIPLFVGAALVLRRPLVLGARAVWPAVGAGVLDMAANGLFLVSTRLGFLAVVAVLVSLYPAMTIVLARFFLHERVGVIQKAGLGLAGIGVALMAMGG